MTYPVLKFTGLVNIDYLKKYADEMTRVAASLKMGTVTAPTLISNKPIPNKITWGCPVYVRLTSLWTIS